MDTHCQNCGAEITEANQDTTCVCCGVEQCASCRACECTTPLSAAFSSPVFPNVKRAARAVAIGA